MRQWCWDSRFSVSSTPRISSLYFGLKEFTLVYGPHDHNGVFGWIFWGSKAALAPAVLSLGAACALTAVLEFERLAARVSPRVRTLEGSALALVHRWSLHQIDVVSSLSLLSSTAVLVGTTWYFAPMLTTFTNTLPDLSTVPVNMVALLSPDHHAYQVSYREAFIAAGIICVALWYPAAALAIRTRQHIPRRALFGGAIVMTFLVLFLDFPYRLLYHMQFDEVTWRGHSCHLLGTNGDDRLIFCPELPPPRANPVPVGEISRPHETERSLLRFIQEAQRASK